jgi:hypothetical protein
MTDPVLITGRVGFDQSSQTAYVLIPPNMVPIGSGASGASQITMGTAEPVTSGETIAEGVWVFVTSAGVATLIKSDGSETAPDDGNIYELT